MNDEREIIVYGRSTQISEGGMGVTLTGEVPRGTIARLMFKLPGEDDERAVPAEVKYRRGFYCGFEFLALSASERTELRSFCIQAAR